jgi:predicted nucleic acid-binding Zn ribbon protein
MIRAGDLLSAILPERDALDKAHEYHRLFSSWRAIAGERLAAHSHLIELEHSVLLVEAEHPGWIQLLQMEQERLLSNARRLFPELGITGIAFRLSRKG